MRTLGALALVATLAATPSSAFAAGKELDAKQKAAVTQHLAEVAKWAASPKVVADVKAQNARGPLEGMDEGKWKSLKRSDPIVKAFQDGAAGKLLAEKLGASKGLFVEAFLSGTRGEKVAFVGKTTSYIHVGKPKFDVPFTTGKPWIGQPEFDESTQSQTVQVSVPVVDGGKAIGVLVVGLSVSALN